MVDIDKPDVTPIDDPCCSGRSTEIDLSLGLDVARDSRFELAAGNHKWCGKFGGDLHAGD